MKIVPKNVLAVVQEDLDRSRLVKQIYFHAQEVWGKVKVMNKDMANQIEVFQRHIRNNGAQEY